MFLVTQGLGSPLLVTQGFGTAVAGGAVWSHPVYVAPPRAKPVDAVVRPSTQRLLIRQWPCEVETTQIENATVALRLKRVAIRHYAPAVEIESTIAVSAQLFDVYAMLRAEEDENIINTGLPFA